MYTLIARLLGIWLPSSGAVLEADWSASQVQRHLTHLLTDKLCWSAENATKLAAQWQNGSGKQLWDASAANLQTLFGAGIGECLFKLVRNERCELQSHTTTGYACDLSK